MDLGIIGPKRSIKRISSVIKKNFKYFNIVNLYYDTYKDAAKIAKKHQSNLDGLLFTGTTPFVYASEHVNPTIPWEYIPRHGSSLLSILLEGIINNYDIKNISFDSYDLDKLHEAYEEIGLKKKDLNIYVAEDRILKDDYIKSLYNFHKENYLKGRVSCCITGIVNVYKKLNSENIPCYKIRHTSNIIRETVTKLKLKHLALINESNQIVVLSIEMDLPEEQSLIHKNEYQLTLQKMKVTEEIYLFAQRIQAAVVEVGFGNYLLFSTKSILESETNNLSKFQLVDMIDKNTSNTVSIGIGYGRTAREAKYGANLGKSRAKKFKGNTVYAVYEGEKIIGPINNLKQKNENENIIDKRLLTIAEKSELSVNAIFKLNSIKKQYRLDNVTPKELARLYGITLRSMNRIINKLEGSGYVEIVGKKVIEKAGRPSRVIRLKI